MTDIVEELDAWLVNLRRAGAEKGGGYLMWVRARDEIVALRQRPHWETVRAQTLEQAALVCDALIEDEIEDGGELALLRSVARAIRALATPVG